jgi:2-amino-4-hydroxy-6-hydroxymethyldihydropteridine diphosphokinase
MNRVVISLGSNVEDRMARVAAAMTWIQSILHSTDCSGIYETDDFHPTGRKYCNAVMAGDTALSQGEIDAAAGLYELNAGRDEPARLRGDVPIDIDLVMWNGTVLRPRDMEREYFLRGYRELGPETYRSEQ